MSIHHAQSSVFLASWQVSSTWAGIVPLNFKVATSVLIMTAIFAKKY